MKLLFVDDNKNRLAMLKLALSFFPTITYARTSYEAIDHMENEQFDVIMLDHDLGDDQDNPTEDGRAIAHWIDDNLDTECNVNTVFIIHSFNTPAAREMASILEHNPELQAPMLIPFNAKILANVLFAIKEELHALETT